MFRKRLQCEDTEATAPDFPDTLERMGLCLKDNEFLSDKFTSLLIRLIFLDEPYRYDYTNDSNYNHLRYEKIIDLLIEEIENRLINKYNFKKQHYPIDKQNSYFLHSQNALNKSEHSSTILLVNGLKGRKYIWSTMSLVKLGISKGSVLQFVDEFHLNHSYEIIIANPNELFMLDGKLPSYRLENNGNYTDIVENVNTPEDHILYLFNEFIKENVANLFCIAHEYGGHSITNLINLHPETLRIIKAVALIESTHSILTITNENKHETLIWFKQNVINWTRSNLPLNDLVMDFRFGCNCLSSGGDDNFPNNLFGLVLPSIVEFFNSRRM